MKLIVTTEDAGARLDLWLCGEIADISRSRIQALIKSDHITCSGKTVKANHKVAVGEEFLIEIPKPETIDLLPENIPLDIIHEDNDMLVINKPAGMTVHPAPGHPSGTLVNAVLGHCPDLPGIKGEVRPGIVHRLDKDTSGVIIIAKTDSALQSVSDQFRNRETKKLYKALVWGHPKPAKGRIETTIGRSTQNRKMMSVNSPVGRDAVSNYNTVEILGHAALVDIGIETGRTHQTRVHMSHIHTPILGDRVYSRRQPWKAAGVEVPRQMLHAYQLTVTHPSSGAEMTFTADIPEDMEETIRMLSDKC